MSDRSPEREDEAEDVHPAPEGEVERVTGHSTAPDALDRLVSDLRVRRAALGAQLLLQHLRLMALHKLGVSARVATVLDFALERKRITTAQVESVVERAEGNDLMVQIILISDGVMTADEVNEVAVSQRRRGVNRIFADLDEADAESEEA